MFPFNKSVRQSAYRSMLSTFYPQNPNLKVAVDQLPKSSSQGLGDAARKVDDLLATG